MAARKHLETGSVKSSISRSKKFSNLEDLDEATLSEAKALFAQDKTITSIDTELKKTMRPHFNFRANYDEYYLALSFTFQLLVPGLNRQELLAETILSRMFDLVDYNLCSDPKEKISGYYLRKCMIKFALQRWPELEKEVNLFLESVRNLSDSDLTKKDKLVFAYEYKIHALQGQEKWAEMENQLKLFLESISHLPETNSIKKIHYNTAQQFQNVVLEKLGKLAEAAKLRSELALLYPAEPKMEENKEKNNSNADTKSTSRVESNLPLLTPKMPMALINIPDPLISRAIINLELKKTPMDGKLDERRMKKAVLLLQTTEDYILKQNYARALQNCNMFISDFGNDIFVLPIYFHKAYALLHIKPETNDPAEAKQIQHTNYLEALSLINKVILKLTKVFSTASEKQAFYAHYLCQSYFIKGMLMLNLNVVLDKNSHQLEQQAFKVLMNGIMQDNTQTATSYARICEEAFQELLIFTTDLPEHEYTDKYAPLIDAYRSIDAAEEQLSENQSAEATELYNEASKLLSSAIHLDTTDNPNHEPSLLTANSELLFSRGLARLHANEIESAFNDFALAIYIDKNQLFAHKTHPDPMHFSNITAKLMRHYWKRGLCQLDIAQPELCQSDFNSLKRLIKTFAPKETDSVSFAALYNNIIQKINEGKLEDAIYDVEDIFSIAYLFNLSARDFDKLDKLIDRVFQSATHAFSPKVATESPAQVATATAEGQTQTEAAPKQKKKGKKKQANTSNGAEDSEEARLKAENIRKAKEAKEEADRHKLELKMAEDKRKKEIKKANSLAEQERTKQAKEAKRIQEEKAAAEAEELRKQKEDEENRIAKEKREAAEKKRIESENAANERARIKHARYAKKKVKELADELVDDILPIAHAEVIEEEEAKLKAEAELKAKEEARIEEEKRKKAAPTKVRQLAFSVANRYDTVVTKPLAMRDQSIPSGLSLHKEKSYSPLSALPLSHSPSMNVLFSPGTATSDSDSSLTENSPHSAASLSSFNSENTSDIKQNQNTFAKHLLKEKILELKKALLKEISSFNTPEGQELEKIFKALDQLLIKIDLPTINSKHSVADALDRLETKAGATKAFVVGNIPRDAQLGRNFFRMKRTFNATHSELDVDLLADLSFDKEEALGKLRLAFPKSENYEVISTDLEGLYTVMDTSTGQKLYQIMNSKYLQLDKNSEKYKSDPLFYDALSRDFLHNAIYADKNGLVYTPLLGTLVALVYKLIHAINKKALFEAEGREFDEKLHSPEFYSYSEKNGHWRVLRGITPIISYGCEISPEGEIFSNFNFSDDFAKSIPEGVSLLLPEKKGLDYTDDQKKIIRSLNLFLSSKVFCRFESSSVFYLFSQRNIIQTLFPGLWETVPREEINKVLERESTLEHIYTSLLVLQYHEALKSFCESHQFRDATFIQDFEKLVKELISKQPLYQVCFEDHPVKIAKYRQMKEKTSTKAFVDLPSITTILLDKIQFQSNIKLPPLPIEVVPPKEPVQPFRVDQQGIMYPVPLETMADSSKARIQPHSADPGQHMALNPHHALHYGFAGQPAQIQERKLSAQMALQYPIPASTHWGHAPDFSRGSPPFRGRGRGRNRGGFFDRRTPHTDNGYRNNSRGAGGRGAATPMLPGHFTHFRPAVLQIQPQPVNLSDKGPLLSINASLLSHQFNITL